MEGLSFTSWCVIYIKIGFHMCLYFKIKKRDHGNFFNTLGM